MLIFRNLADASRRNLLDRKRKLDKSEIDNMVNFTYYIVYLPKVFYNLTPEINNNKPTEFFLHSKEAIMAIIGYYKEESTDLWSLTFS